MLTLQEAWNKEGTVWLEIKYVQEVREAFLVWNTDEEEINHFHMVDRYFRRYTFPPEQYNREFRCWNKWPFIWEREENEWR